MTRRIAPFLMALGLSCLSSAQEMPSGFGQTEIAGAQNFRLMWKEDPSSTITIGFAATSSTVSEHKVHFDTEDHGRDIHAYRQVAKADLMFDFKGMHNAFVHLKNLLPAHSYYFVISDPKGVSKRYWFQTASNLPKERISLVVGGDSRNNRAPRRGANLLVAKLRPNAVMFGGDYTADGSNSEWSQWFEDWQLTIADDGRMTPLVATRGNHESSNEVLQKLFDTPPGAYFAITLGGNLLRIYTLNSESGIAGNQTSWLAADLTKSSQVKWKFAQYHRPMRPHTQGKGNGTSQYNNWAELFYKNKMTLVSESDSHTTKTTWPIRPSNSGGSSDGFIRDDADGTVYVGEGCWGAPLRPDNDRKPWTRASGEFNQFNWIFVDSETVQVQVIKVDNADKVGSVTDADRFTAPINLDIWKPATGAVVTIRKTQ